MLPRFEERCRNPQWRDDLESCLLAVLAGETLKRKMFQHFIVLMFEGLRRLNPFERAHAGFIRFGVDATSESTLPISWASLSTFRSKPMWGQFATT